MKAVEVDMFAGVSSDDKDPRKSTHVEPFPLTELAPDEAYVDAMAAAINFNTVWTSIFEPVADVRVLEASRTGECVRCTARPAVPRDGFRRVGRRVAGRLRAAELEAHRLR